MQPLRLLAIALLALAAINPWPAAAATSRSTEYDGTTSAYYRYDAKPSHATDNAMSIEAWIYRQEAERAEILVSRGLTNSYTLGFYLNTAGDHYTLQFSRSGGVFADSGLLVPPWKWTHLTVVFDGTNVSFYLDEALAAQKPLAHPLRGTEPSGFLFVGGTPGGLNFHGHLDEVRLYPGVVEPDAVVQNMYYESTELPVAQPLALAQLPAGGQREMRNSDNGTHGNGITGRTFGMLPHRLSIPRGAYAVTVDGVPHFNNEFFKAEQVVLRYPDKPAEPDRILYLIYRDSPGDQNLYAAVRSSHPDSAGLAPAGTSFGLMVCPTNASHFIDDTDFRIRVLPDSPAAAWQRGSESFFWEDDPAPPPAANWAAARSFSDGEFTAPTFEFRIAKAELGFTWTETDRLGFGHFAPPPDTGGYVRPEWGGPSFGGEVSRSTALWAEMTYESEFNTVPATASFAGYLRDGIPSNPLPPGLPGQTIWLYDHDTNTPLASAVTDAAGRYAFTSVAIEADRQLRLQWAPQPPAWLHEWDATGGEADTAPHTITSTYAIFPGCSGSHCDYAELTFYVLRALPATTLGSFSPAQGHPRVTLRLPSSEEPTAKFLSGTLITIQGTNLHHLLRFHLYDCDDIPPLSDCTPGDDYFECRTDAVAPDRTWVRIELPELPWGRYQTDRLQWRLVAQDDWDRPGRAPWLLAKNGPTLADTWFTLTEIPFPLLSGFEFVNVSYPGEWGDFDGVFDCDAYITCLGPVRTPAAYAWKPIYNEWVNMPGSAGSCVGMAATSLLLHHGDLRPLNFNSGSAFPAGIPGVRTGGPGTTPMPKLPPRYSNCDPGHFGPCHPAHNSLFARIRTNHGVQTSLEHISAGLDQLTGAGIALAGGGVSASIDGNPNAVLAAVRTYPLQRVICVTPSLTAGHCVVPYAITDGVDTDNDGDIDPQVSRIHVCDSNYPEDTTRYIDIDTAANTYRFTRNTLVSLFDDWTGRGIFALPLSIWRNERTVPDIFDLGGSLLMLAFGGADAHVSAGAGEWGWRQDGTVTDTIPGAKALVPLAGDIPDANSRNVPVFLPNTITSATMDINVRGSSYVSMAGQNQITGTIIATGAVPGSRDTLTFAPAPGGLPSLRFTGRQPAAQRTLRLRWRNPAGTEWSQFRLELPDLPAGGIVECRMRSDGHGFDFLNDSAASIRPRLIVDGTTGGSATASDFGLVIIAPAATHSLILNNWPATATALSQLDLNRDGTPESTQTLTSGSPATALPALSLTISGPDLVLTWPLRSDAEIFLQQTNDLDLWQPWSGDITATNGLYRAVFPFAESSKRFFRLRASSP